MIALGLAACTSGQGATPSTAPPPSASTPEASTTSGTHAPTTSATTSAKHDLAGRIVAIDPGHNGANASHGAEIAKLVDAGGFQKPCNTTGTSEAGLTESRANWLVAQQVRDLLAARGATVVLTRSSDEGWGPCVDQRGLAAGRAGADVLVSIHADGAAASAHGFHLIRPLPGPTVSTARASASGALAEDLRDALVAQGLTPSTYVGTAGIIGRTDIATVNRATVPAVMLESGNMHNAKDFELLSTDTGRARLARGIVDGIAAYLHATT